LNTFNCPSCGASVKAERGPGEYKIRIVCKKCTRPFSASFHPTEEELQDRFMKGELEPDIVPRLREPQDDFPDAAIFSIFKKR